MFFLNNVKQFVLQVFVPVSPLNTFFLHDFIQSKLLHISLNKHNRLFIMCLNSTASDATGIFSVQS